MANETFDLTRIKNLIQDIKQSSPRLYEALDMLSAHVNILDSRETTTTPSQGGTLNLTGFTQGSLLYVNPAETLAQSNANLFVDSTTKRVGLGTNTPHATAQLEINSTTRGLLLPRMTTTERDAIGTPAEGLIIYNTTTHATQEYDGTVWRTISGGSAGGWTDDGTVVRLTTATDQVVIGANTGNASAALDLISTTRGFLVPRMNQTQRDAIGTPATGLMIWSTTLARFEYYNGSAWVGFGNLSGWTGAANNKSESYVTKVTIGSAVGTSSAKLEVIGSITIGSGYEDSSLVPTDGAIIKGRVAIGHSLVPSGDTLYVRGLNSGDNAQVTIEGQGSSSVGLLRLKTATAVDGGGLEIHNGSLIVTLRASDTTFKLLNSNFTSFMYMNMATKGIGINISTPDSSVELDVNGVLRIRGGTPGANKVLTSDANGIASWRNNTSGWFEDTGSIPTVVRVNDVGSWVSIGAASSPQARLHIKGSENYQVRIEGTGTAAGLQLWVGGAVRGYLDATNDRVALVGSSSIGYVAVTNNVGIKTITPAFDLDVAGSVRISQQTILGLQASLTTQAVRADRLINTGDGLSGGGNLTADRTLSVNFGIGFTQVARGANTLIFSAGNGLSGGGTITIGNGGGVSYSLNLGNANTWTALQTFSTKIVISDPTLPFVEFQTSGTPRGNLAANSSVIGVSNSAGSGYIHIRQSDGVIIFSGKEISYGVADSGGAGFRIVRVPN